MIDRRQALRTIGVFGIAGAVAGCLGDSSSDGTAGNGITPSSNVESYLSSVPNYEGYLEDLTGQAEVMVTVGSGDGFRYDPPAILIDVGTTVVWEWTGEGGAHDVTDIEGSFGSDMVADEGTTFDHEFTESGEYLYVCTPHDSMEMKGAVVAE